METKHNKPQSLDETYFKVTSMSIDDFIENDPIAEAIYYVLVVIQQSNTTLHLDSKYEVLFSEARLKIIQAYNEKHPEIDFDKKYIEKFGQGIFSYLDKEAVFCIIYASLSLCSSLPKNMSLFNNVVYLYLQRYGGSSINVLPTFESLIAEEKKKGHSYIIEDLLGTERHVEQTPTTKDWKTLTEYYNEEAIKRCVLSNALTPKERMKTVDAIEAQYELDHISDPCLGSRVSIFFFNRLRKLISIDLNDGSLPQKSESTRARKLKKEIGEQKEEIIQLKRTIKDKESEIKELNKTIGEASAEIHILRAKIEKFSEDKSDLKESEEAKVDDEGIRTRKVTTMVLNELFAIIRSGEWVAPSAINKARAISYLTNFSQEKVRQDLSSTDLLKKGHSKEIDEVKAIFKDIGIELKLPIKEK